MLEQALMVKNVDYLTIIFGMHRFDAHTALRLCNETRLATLREHLWRLLQMRGVVSRL